MSSTERVLKYMLEHRRPVSTAEIKDHLIGTGCYASITPKGALRRLEARRKIIQTKKGWVLVDALSTAT